MELDTKRMYEDICKINKYLKKSNSKYFIGDNYSQYNCLVEMYDDANNSFSKDLLMSEIEDNRLYDYLNDDRSIYKYADYVELNRETLTNISENMRNIYNRINFFPIISSDRFKKLNDDELKELLLDFFSKYGNNVYKVVKKYIDEKRIYVLTNDKYSSGFFINFPCIKSGYIEVSTNGINTLSASTLAHELGHAIDFELFLFPQNKRINTFTDALIELPSTTFELLFSKSLIDNRIDETGGLLIKNAINSKLNVYMKSMKDALDIGEPIYDQYGNITRDFIEDGEEYSEIHLFRDSLIYGLGYFIANHLSLIEEDNKKEFIKILNNISTSRKECNDLRDLISKLEFDTDKVISSSLIEDNIKNDTITLNKKYNIY